MDIKYALVFCFLVLLSSSAAAAEGIRVMYFYNSPYVYSEEVELKIATVKNKWQEKVEWLDYDWSSGEKAVRKQFDVHAIVSIPVIVVECGEQTVKIKRAMDMAEQLDEAIINCYGEDITQTTTAPTSRPNFFEIRDYFSDEVIFRMMATILICAAIITAIFATKIKMSDEKK